MASTARASPSTTDEGDLIGGEAEEVEAKAPTHKETRPRAGMWPLGLRERLPAIPIPLRDPDPDAQLDLQEVLHDIYDRARYGTYIYEDSPDPPLAPDDDAWARQFVPSNDQG